MLTIKSDDVVGRAKAFEAIVKGTDIPQALIPESFKVLVKELQALSLNVETLGAKIVSAPVVEEEPEIKAEALELAKVLADEAIGVNAEIEQELTSPDSPVEIIDQETESLIPLEEKRDE